MPSLPPPPPRIVETLQEIATVGIGRAAGGLSELTGREVGLSLPSIGFGSLELAEQRGDVQRGTSVRVSQGFTGRLSGQAVLVIRDHEAHRLLELLLGQKSGHDFFDEIERGALLEMGNVVLAAVLGTMAHHLERPLQYQMPQLQLRGVEGVRDTLCDLAELSLARLLILPITLSMGAEAVSSCLLVVLGDPGLQEWARHVEATRPKM